MSLVHISFCHDISFIEPQNNNKKSDSHANGPHSLFLLDTTYRLDIFQYIPKTFTITTRNGSCNFNLEMLIDTSSIIRQEYRSNPKINIYHLDIADEENVLEKFGQLFQGKTVTFTDENLIISYKIVRTLNLLNCPNFMKPYDLQKQQKIPRNFHITQTIEQNTENEAVIDFTSLNNFLMHNFKQTFSIITNKKEYKCKLYAVYSSQVISDFLKTHQNADQYRYEFEDEYGEFEDICKVFNFEKVSITRDNMSTLSKIIDDLEITFLKEQMNKFNSNYDKMNEEFEYQQEEIDELSEIIDHLYHINSENVDKFGDELKEKRRFEKSDSVRELTSYIIQVLKTDETRHESLLQLIENLSKSKGNNSTMKNIKSEIIQQVLFLLGINKSICSFAYKLYKLGYIQKDQLFDSINQAMTDNFNQAKHYCYPYILENSLDKTNKKEKNLIFPIIIENLNLWFSQELFEMHENNILKYATIEGFYTYYKNPKKPSKAAKSTNTNEDETTSQFNYELYEKMRNNYHSCDELTMSLRNDDIEKLESILPTQKDHFVPYNIFDEFISKEKISFLNYAAAYGSLKCFNYLLSKGHKSDDKTFELAIYGGNIEIVKISEDLLKQKVSILKKLMNQNIDLISYFNPAIAKHRNEIFDYLLNDQFLKIDVKNREVINSLMILSCKNGNIHSLIQIIKKGYDFENNINDFANYAAANGFYRIIILLCHLTKKKSIALHVITMRNSFYAEFYPALMTENLSILKLFDKHSKRSIARAIIEYSISREFKSIIQYYIEEYLDLFDHHFIFSCLASALILPRPDIFIYLFDQIQTYNFHSLNNQNKISMLLSKACILNKVEISIKLIQYILLINEKFDFSDFFIQAVASNSIEICQFILDNKLFINYFNILNKFDIIKKVNEKTFTLFINSIPHEIKQLFINNNLNVAIRSENIYLIEYLLKQKVESSNSLIEAVKTNNIEVVNTVLKYIDHIFINNNSNEGPAICIASRKNNQSIIKRLLCYSEIDLSLFGPDNMSALNIAINNMNIEIINTFLEFYGDKIKNETTQLNESLKLILELNSKSKFNSENNSLTKNILIQDIQQDKVIKILPIFKRIIEIENVDLNICSGDFTVLSFASKMNEKEIVEFLLNTNKVDVNLTGPNNGNTALMNSIINNNYDITKVLLEYRTIDINQRNYENKSALILSVESNNIEIIKLLIEHPTFNSTQSFLNYAFYISTPEISKQLISIKNLDVNYMSTNNNKIKKIDSFTKISDLYSTKLIDIISSSSPDLEIIDLIIQHPSFDKEKSLAKYALFKSTQKNVSIEIFKKLLTLFDNDINIINEDGNSLLTTATNNRNLNLITYILNDPNFDCNKNGFINLFNISLFIPNLQKQIYKYVEEHHDSIDFNCKSKPDGLTIFTSIIHKYIPNFKTKNEEKAEKPPKLNESFEYISTLVKFLCQNGADPNLQDDKGEYPLELSLKNAANEPLEYFSFSLYDSKKIDFSTKIYEKGSDSCFTSYLHLAIKNKSRIIERLIKDKSIDINITDSNGDTPLIIACRKEMTFIIKLLFTRDDLDYLHRNNEGNDALMIVFKDDENVKNKEIQNKDEYLKILTNDFILPKFKFSKSSKNDSKGSSSETSKSQFKSSSNNQKKEFSFSNPTSNTNSVNNSEIENNSKSKYKFSFNNLSQPNKQSKFSFSNSHTKTKTTETETDLNNQNSTLNLDSNIQSKTTKQTKFNFNNLSTKTTTETNSNNQPSKPIPEFSFCNPSQSNKQTKFSFNKSLPKTTTKTETDLNNQNSKTALNLDNPSQSNKQTKFNFNKSLPKTTTETDLNTQNSKTTLNLDNLSQTNKQTKFNFSNSLTKATTETNSNNQPSKPNTKFNFSNPSQSNEQTIFNFSKSMPKTTTTETETDLNNQNSKTNSDATLNINFNIQSQTTKQTKFNFSILTPKTGSETSSNDQLSKPNSEIDLNNQNSNTNSDTLNKQSKKKFRFNFNSFSQPNKPNPEITNTPKETTESNSNNDQS